MGKGGSVSDREKTAMSEDTPVNTVDVHHAGLVRGQVQPQRGDHLRNLVPQRLGVATLTVDDEHEVVGLCRARDYAASDHVVPGQRHFRGCGVSIILVVGFVVCLSGGCQFLRTGDDHGSRCGCRLGADGRRWG